MNQTLPPKYWRMKKMPEKERVKQHEQSLNNQNQKIVELESKAQYKDIVIMELKDDMREIKNAVNVLNENFNKFTVKSIKDDNLLKDIINEQNNRLTALETRIEQQDKDFKTWLSIITIAFAALTFYFNFIH